MKTKTISRILISLVILFTKNILLGQPTTNVQAPNSYSNPVVIMIPDTVANVDLTGVKTGVHLYVIKNNTGNLINIVSNDSLISTYTKYKATVHVRGDATALDPKKQFEIKINHEKSDTGNFLGMQNSGKDWVFNDCGAVDMTLMRNVITFSSQSNLGQYSPEWKWFELFICDSSASINEMSSILSNDYWGVYLNFDKIMFAPDRINAPYSANVSKHDIPYDYAIIQLNQASPKYYRLPVDSTEPIALTAGVQVYYPKKEDLCSYSATDSAFIINNINNWYYNTSPQTDSTNWAGQINNYYLNYLMSSSSSTDTTGKAAALSAIRQMTDYNSFAVYFIMNELSKDPDGYHKSTFMVKNEDVCYAGPLWDKNKSYGNLANNPDTSFFYNQPTGWLFHDPSNTINSNQCPVWWYVFLSDSLFCKQVWNIWQSESSNEGVLAYSTLDSTIKAQYNYLTTPYTVSNSDTTNALLRNNQCWPNGYNQTQALYNAQITQLKYYLQNRLIWINKNLEDLLSESGLKID